MATKATVKKTPARKTAAKSTVKRGPVKAAQSARKTEKKKTVDSFNINPSTGVWLQWARNGNADSKNLTVLHLLTGATVGAECIDGVDSDAASPDAYVVDRSRAPSKHPTGVCAYCASLCLEAQRNGIRVPMLPPGFKVAGLKTAARAAKIKR